MFHKGLVLHGVSTVSAGITIAAQSTILTPSLSLNHRHDKKLSKYYKLVKICPPHAPLFCTLWGGGVCLNIQLVVCIYSNGSLRQYARGR